MIGYNNLLKKVKQNIEILFLILTILVFVFSILRLQSLKAPWVDECYTYYGIWHDNFIEFSSSILTGINYSPHSTSSLILYSN